MSGEYSERIDSSSQPAGYRAVRSYESERSLSRVVAEFLQEGFERGSPGIVIATANQRAAITRELTDRSIDVIRLQRSRDLLLLDGDETLSTFMSDGIPDARKFMDQVHSVIESVRRGRTNCTVHMFGRMVDLLWQRGERDAAIRLDALWNQLAVPVGIHILDMHPSPPVDPARERSPGTLGDVLYANPSQALVSETEWVALVRSVAAGDQRALYTLYERAHRVVFTLAMRITANRETAEEVTMDVFHDVWRRAARYEEAGGTVLGWIMNQARSRAIDRLRFEQRKKRLHPDHGDQWPETGMADPNDLLAFKQQSQVLRRALDVLTPDERHAIEAAFFSELTYVEVAARLNQPLGTIKTRIRSGLHKLRQALAEGGRRT